MLTGARLGNLFHSSAPDCDVDVDSRLASDGFTVLTGKGGSWHILRNSIPAEMPPEGRRFERDPAFEAARWTYGLLRQKMPTFKNDIPPPT
jgi:hypothetical protein